MAILGIDEVGRGPWAGPLVVGACVLGDAQINGLTDSKKLSAKRREELAAKIHAQCACGLGWVPAAELDKLGLSAALCKACREAVKQIKTPFHQIIIDGTANFLRDTPLANHVQVLKKADLLVPEVSAASIIAKVARDNYMIELAKRYPDYGFEKHVGYGTALHRAAIEKYGVCPEHRMSFKPIATLTQPAVAKTTRMIGDQGETATAEYLADHGHKIITRNWKNRFCEIDIISEKAGILYFTEVKYRRNVRKNSGIDAITSKKLAQMRFAAELYLAEQKIDRSARLAIAEVSGDNFAITGYLVLE